MHVLLYQFQSCVVLVRCKITCVLIIIFSKIIFSKIIFSKKHSFKNHIFKKQLIQIINNLFKDTRFAGSFIWNVCSQNGKQCFSMWRIFSYLQALNNMQQAFLVGHSKGAHKVYILGNKTMLNTRLYKSTLCILNRKQNLNIRFFLIV